MLDGGYPIVGMHEGGATNPGRNKWVLSIVYWYGSVRQRSLPALERRPASYSYDLGDELS